MKRESDVSLCDLSDRRTEEGKADESNVTNGENVYVFLLSLLRIRSVT